MMIKLKDTGSDRCLPTGMAPGVVPLIFIVYAFNAHSQTYRKFR